MKQGVCLEFPAENQVDFNGRVDFVMKEKAQKTLHKFTLEGHGGSTEVWSTKIPPGVNTDGVIALYGSGYSDAKPILQDKGTSATLVLTSNGTELLDSWHHKGILLTCLDFEHPVYAVEKTEGEYEIVIVRYNKSETRLQPVTTKPTWSHPYLSVCKDVVTDMLAVTSADPSLDIYKWLWGK